MRGSACAARGAATAAKRGRRARHRRPSATRSTRGATLPVRSSPPPPPRGQRRTGGVPVPLGEGRAALRRQVREQGDPALPDRQCARRTTTARTCDYSRAARRRHTRGAGTPAGAHRAAVGGGNGQVPSAARLQSGNEVQSCRRKIAICLQARRVVLEARRRRRRDTSLMNLNTFSRCRHVWVCAKSPGQLERRRAGGPTTSRTCAAVPPGAWCTTATRRGAAART